MAYPTSLDTIYNNHSGTDARTDHAQLHNQLANAVMALETKVGIDGSVDTDSIEYKLGEKVDKVTGKGLSENDFDDAYKAKLDHIDITQDVNLDSMESQIGTLETDVLGLITNKQGAMQWKSQGVNKGGLGEVLTVAFTGNGITANEAGGQLSIAITGMPQPEPGVQNELPDSQVPPNTSTTLPNNSQKWVKVTGTDGSYVLYLATGHSHPSGLPAGVYYYNKNNELISSKAKAGTYDVPTQTITQADGTSISGTTGAATFSDGKIAYVNKPNEFDQINTFKGTSYFTGQATFTYNPASVNIVHFDAATGQKQKFVLNTPATHTLTFENLITGGNYVFTIVVSGGSCTLNKAVNTTGFTNCDTIKYMYTVGAPGAAADIYPLTLANGVHIFVAEAFSDAIHVSYVGQSQNFTP